MNRAWFIILGVVLVGGCSPEWYRRSADLQVADILRDRREQTLGYSPEVDVPEAIPAEPAKRAYAKIPTTPKAPPTTAPIQPDRVVLPYQPLGPENYWKDALPTEMQQGGSELLDRRMSRLPAYGPEDPNRKVLTLDLFGCIEYAVEHSRDYQTRMEQLYLSALTVTLERHLLSPRPFVTQRASFTGGQRASNYRHAYAVTTSAGVRQRLPYGGEIVAETLVDFVEVLNDNVSDGERAEVAMSGSIPLLRGAGMVNLEGLISSERELVYQVRAFEDFRRSFVVNIASQYFRLLASQQGVINRRLSVANLAALTEKTEALHEFGRTNFLEVQRSLQSLLQTEAALIDAEEAYQGALDDFKLALGISVDERIDVAPVELVVDIPKIGADEAVDLAHRYRLDLRTAQDRIEDAHRGVKYARNGLLPRLDMSFGAAVDNGEESQFNRLRGDTVDYDAGFTLDLPVDRVAERNAYRRALISFHGAERSFAAAKDRITADVRDSLRAIRAAEVSVLIQQRGIELAQRRLEYSNELVRQGRANAREVVEAQTSLLDAQDNYEQARSNLQIRVLEFLRDTGTLRVDPQAGALGQAMDRVAARRGDVPQALRGKMDVSDEGIPYR